MARALSVRLRRCLIAVLCSGCSFLPEKGAILDPDEDGAVFGEDCDDTRADVYPGAAEVCDGVDNDCDGLGDDEEAVDADTWYLDGDGDGFGDGLNPATACARPPGYADNDDDCDDDDATTWPGAAEVCGDGVVNDCESDEATAWESCGLSGVIGLSGADAKLVGESGETLAGFSVSGAGDVNGDGSADVLIGAPGAYTAGTLAGASYLVLGPVTGTFDLSEADTRLLGESAGDYAGYSVSGAGDADGDGFDDVVVGACHESTGGTEAGAAYLILGVVTGTHDLSEADAKLVGENTSDRAGCAVSGAGDADGDGVDDLLIGAYNENLGDAAAGAAYLVLGPVTISDLLNADAKLRGEKADDLAGYSVSGTGDVDGDGAADVLVGAPSDDTAGMSAGAVYLVLAPVLGTLELSEADAKLLGESADDEVGSAVSEAGDVDGDGAADLLVGAHAEDTGGSNAGAAYLVYGPVTGERDLSGADARLVGEEASDLAGVSVSGAGDVDRDGCADLLIGARDQDAAASASGAAYLVYGPLTGEHDLSGADAKLVGEAEGDGVGASVSEAGDTDGDGNADLLVGAFGEDSGGTSAGAAYLVLGRSW